MPIPRTIRIASLATALALALAFAAIAPAVDGPAPVVTLTGAVTPSKGHIKSHTPLTLRLTTVFKSVPPGGDFVLQGFTYLFPKGAVVNGSLFLSCNAAKLQAAHGALGVCPKGAKIGSGTATGTAIALGVTATGALTLFNGPGGKSITLNIDIVRPAAIDATWSAPLVKVGGRYAYRLSETLPDSLKTVLGGDVVARKVNVTVGATRVVKGFRRGYIEALNCPKGKAPLHGDFTFNQGAKASAETMLAC
jgi:hypothetical protein